MLFTSKLWLFLWLLVVVNVPLSTSAAVSGLRGDPVAIDNMYRMLDNLGGRDIWAQARSLFTMEKARHPKYGGGIIASHWRDLERPAEKVQLQAPKLNLTYAWNESGGWFSRDGEVRELIADEIHEKVYYWHRELYTLYHELAVGDRSLRLEAIQPNGFRVWNENEEKLAEFRLTPDGELYYWQRFGGKKTTIYLFGPHKSFGSSRFPDWSASSDGDWESYFVQVLPSTKPFDAHVSMGKPKRDWHGGAVNKNCDRDQ